MVNIALLGCGGMAPLPNRHLTSLLVSNNGKMLLIDCGEGTQVSLKMLKWGFKAIDVVCFTHYHADHIAGLPGMLLTIGNSGRTEPLTLIGPIGLKAVIQGLSVIAPILPFELKLIEIQEGYSIEETVEGFNISSIYVEHSIPCMAYKIEIKRQRKFDVNKAKENNVPMSLWNRLQKEEKIEHDNKLFIPDMVLGEERKGISISYCTDSRPTEKLEGFIKESDLFICEGMYGENENLEKAIENKHMLFSEAALLAKKGDVKELWLTHYSPSLLNPIDFLEETKCIFENTVVGEDRMNKILNFE